MGQCGLVRGVLQRNDWQGDTMGAIRGSISHKEMTDSET